MSTEKPTDDGEEWPVTFEQVREYQQRLVLKATPEQRLRWLEGAIKMAAAVGAIKPREVPPEWAEEAAALKQDS